MDKRQFFGVAAKYAEGLLAVKYRQIDDDGHVLGGPFYYIEKGMGKSWKWLAKCFALFGVLAGLLGIGTISGLALMKMEHMRMGWFFRNIGWKALVGGVAGLAILWLSHTLMGRAVYLMI